jgi:hypothetical protein
MYSNTLVSNGFTIHNPALRMQEIDNGSICNAVNGGVCYACNYPVPYQLGRGTNNTPDPIYFWNNTRDGSFISPGPYPTSGDTTCQSSTYCGIQLSINNFAVQNRDWYTSNSTAKPGYSAYAYPHPLTSNGVPPAPTNLQVF